MQLTETENQVAIIEKSISIFQTAPQILQSNQLRTQKALSVGNRILGEWQAAWELQDEEQQMQALAAIDIKSNDYMVKCNNALGEEKEARAAITQMMDAFRSMFTTAENEIDKAKPNTVPAKVQAQRNLFATKAHEISERKRMEAERKAARDKEAIDIKYQLENSYSNQFNTYLLERKQKMLAGFNAITLDSFVEKSAKLQALNFSFEFVPHFVYDKSVRYVSNEEFQGIMNNTIDEGKEKYQGTFVAELELYKDELIEKLPSKKNELVEAKRIADEAEQASLEAVRIEEENKIALSKANEEQRVELEAKQRREKAIEDKRLADLKLEQDKAEEYRKQREKEENERLQAEAQDKEAAAALNASIKKEGEQTMSLFEKEAALAEVNNAADIKQGYDIEVTHPVGYTQIFQLWFQTEGQNLPLEKIGNTKLDQMKAWAEKYALKTSTKIESQFIKYHSIVKALNKKAAK